MHELALCESIRSIIEEQSRTQSFARVARVRLAVGPFAGVEVEALRFSFGVAMAGSVAQDAQLEIDEQPGRGWCLPCAEEVAIAQRFDVCPHCGSHQVQMTGGDELKISELEVM
ncbi:MAG: hydrogenase maturation nickel metallochaperone HypA [Pseudomonadota bacterium]